MIIFKYQCKLSSKEIILSHKWNIKIIGKIFCNYNENFWGDKIKVHGVVKNKATVATYKDAVVRVTYYSKTKTELGNKEYTIYEVFPPNSEVKFELKIENYKDVSTIGWDVIQAKAN